MSNIPAKLLVMVNSQKTALPVTIPSLTTTALCKTHIGVMIDSIAMEETNPMQRGLWLDMMPIEAKVGLLAWLHAYEAAIV